MFFNGLVHARNLTKSPFAMRHLLPAGFAIERTYRPFTPQSGTIWHDLAQLRNVTVGPPDGRPKVAAACGVATVGTGRYSKSAAIASGSASHGVSLDPRTMLIAAVIAFTGGMRSQFAEPGFAAKTPAAEVQATLANLRRHLSRSIHACLHPVDDDSSYAGADFLRTEKTLAPTGKRRQSDSPARENA